MPHATTPSSSLAFDCFDNARSVPAAVIQVLGADDVQANPILPALLKLRATPEEDVGNQWFVVSTVGQDPQILYIASCTSTKVGEYPLFIFTATPLNELSHDWLTQDMAQFCRWLAPRIKQERIYSVFAYARVSQAFAKQWKAATGIEAYSKPFYDCYGTYTTPQHLSARRQNSAGLSSKGYEYEITRATTADIPEMAELCELFSEDCAPFFMTPGQCLQEAAYLVEQKAVWVHRIRKQGFNDGWSIASLAAVTRNTEKMATITKVVTSMQWRRLGCAERLTREVCQRLFTAGKERVALFVGRQNPASIVYSKVGFLGLPENPNQVAPRVDGVDQWLELGFDKRRVCQGHW